MQDHELVERPGKGVTPWKADDGASTVDGAVSPLPQAQRVCVGGPSVVIIAAARLIHNLIIRHRPSTLVCGPFIGERMEKHHT
jgi:hypothetical protein